MAFRSLGVVVSTSPSHGGDTGSNPVGSAILSRPLIAFRDFFKRGDEARVGDGTSITRADSIVLGLREMLRPQLTRIDEITDCIDLSGSKRKILSSRDRGQTGDLNRSVTCILLQNIQLVVQAAVLAEQQENLMPEGCIL